MTQLGHEPTAYCMRSECVKHWAIPTRSSFYTAAYDNYDKAFFIDEWRAAHLWNVEELPRMWFGDLASKHRP